MDMDVQNKPVFQSFFASVDIDSLQNLGKQIHAWCTPEKFFSMEPEKNMAAFRVRFISSSNRVQLSTLHPEN